MNSVLKDLQIDTKAGLDWYKTASPKEQKIFRDWLVGVLKTNKVDLTFKKKDDTIREMKCTLIESMLPAIEKKTDRVRKENDDRVVGELQFIEHVDQSSDIFIEGLHHRTIGRAPLRVIRVRLGRVFLDEVGFRVKRGVHRKRPVVEEE